VFQELIVIVVLVVPVLLLRVVQMVNVMIEDMVEVRQEAVKVREQFIIVVLFVLSDISF
jgi:hypothetical protein